MMEEVSKTAATTMEDLLRRLEEGRQAWTDALEACAPQQFAWEDIPDSVLEGWLSLMVDAGKVENQEGKWRWLS